MLSYKTDELSYIDVVLASADFEDLVSRMGLVTDLLSGDKDLVGELESTRDEVPQKSRTSRRRKAPSTRPSPICASRTSSWRRYAPPRRRSSRALSPPASRSRGRSRASPTTSRNSPGRRTPLLAQSQALSDIINGSSGGGHGTGVLMWPAGSRSLVTSYFGWRIHPILGTRRFHTGIDIGVGYGTAIRAADSGKVIYAAGNGGYGNCTIVDHGGGISTLYAHQASIAVGYGATVSRGQVIGYVGSTGLSTGPHLHFEVRSGGQPVDPLGYLP